MEDIIHPAGRRASFCLLDQGGEKESQPESCQAFKVTEARIFGLI